MAGHYMVCGLGHVGHRVVDLLCRLALPVTVVTLPTRPEWIREAEERGVRVILGDARDASLLTEAGLREAAALIVTSDRDLVNVEIALDAKRERPDLPVVVRIFDENLAQQLEASFDVRRALAMSALAAPTFAAAALGARVVSSFRLDEGLFMVGRRAVTHSSPLCGLSVHEIGRRFGLAALMVEGAAGEPLIGQRGETVIASGDRVTLVGDQRSWDRIAGGDDHPRSSDLGSRRATLKRVARPAYWMGLVRRVWNHASLPLRVVFVSLNSLILVSVFVFHFAMGLSFVDALYYIIATVTTTGYGDIAPPHMRPGLRLYSCLVMILGSATIATLYSIITDYIVAARFMQLLGRHRVPHEDHFIVAGLGAVGFRIVDKLRRAGARVVGIDRDGSGEFVQAVRSQTEVVIGEARLADTLLKAGVDQARAVIAVTGDDAANLSAALETKRRNPRARTVVRLFDQGFARKVQEALGVDAAMGAFSISAPTFVAAALYPDVRAAFLLEDRLFVVLDRPAGEAWHGKTPRDLRAEEDVCVLMRRKPGEGAFSVTDADAPLRREERILAAVWRPLARAEEE